MAHCHIAPIIFSFGVSGHCALCFFENAHSPDSDVMVEVTGGMGTRDGRENIALGIWLLC